jgi:hypothetical protein
MRKKIIYSLCTLLLGILIYYLSHKGILIKNDLLSSFIRNYIPDILWVLSFYSFSTLFSKSITKKYIVFTAFYVVIIGIIFEFLQFTGIVKGTFDVFDILVYIISTIIACLIEKYYWGDKK